MEVRLRHTDVRVVPPYPVELVVAVDDEIVWVEIEWPTIAQMVVPAVASEDAVREFLRRNRHGIELVIKAHLFAQGIPLARQLVLSPEDFYGLLPNRPHPIAGSGSLTHPAP